MNRREKIALEEALRRADAANEAKNAFIANMSHEMRTPLNAILGLTELTLDEKGLSDKVSSNLMKIERAGLTLLSIVSDILDMSKIELGKFQLTPAVYEVPARINDTVNQSIMFRGEKNIDFELSIGKNFPARLYGDGLRVKQIFNNLLSNAFKYTTAGKIRFDIKCTRRGGNAYITATVSDTGVGIPDEALPHIYEDYFRADNSANREILGTGLGLSITHKLVRLMGGDITVQSKLGEGSTFTVKFIQKLVSDDVIDSKTIESLKDLTYAPVKRRYLKITPFLRMPYSHILVVDDVETNHDVARGMLLRYDILTTCVSDGPSAIEAIRETIEAGDERFDAIFMDHMMPGMDGVEATRLIREIDSVYAKRVPIIAFTANAAAGSEEMFLENGFQGFVSKPIELTQLDYALLRWVYNAVSANRCKLCQDGDNLAPMCKRKCVRFKNPHSGSAAVIDEPPAVSVFKNFSISDIDFRHGIDRFGGNEGSFLSVLRTFSKNSPAVIENIRSVDVDDLNGYIVAVHGLKGACYGICAYEVGDLAKALEFAGKDGDFDFISAYNEPFITRISSLISDIALFLSSLSDGSPKELRDAPDPALLRAVLEACERRNMSDTDDTVSALEAFDYKSDGELVVWLREQADKMNYSDIIKQLAERQGCLNF